MLVPLAAKPAAQTTVHVLGTLHSVSHVDAAASMLAMTKAEQVWAVANVVSKLHGGASECHTIIIKITPTAPH